jgi:hypothetical protein
VVVIGVNWAVNVELVIAYPGANADIANLQISAVPGE